MYFKGVNRGMAFTKPGFYMTGLVCLAGVLATGSGSNALFLTLGLGLSALVVSGILSERVMHHCSVVGVDPVEGEEGVPFSIEVRVQNTHRSGTCYGLEILGNAVRPRYNILPKAWKSDYSGSLLRIEAGATAMVSIRTNGSVRGRVRSLYLTQTTLFPFNLVRKFKVDSFPVDISIFPRLDNDLMRKLSLEAKRRLQMSMNPQEFHAHRLLNSSDSHRRIDWRKSTSTDSSQWTVKVFRDVSQDFGILIAPRWTTLLTVADAGAFERFLSRVYTSSRFAAREGRVVWIEIGPGQYLPGDLAGELLSGFPRFRQANPWEWLKDQAVSKSARGRVLRLDIDLNSHDWDDSITFLGESR